MHRISISWFSSTKHKTNFNTCNKLGEEGTAQWRVIQGRWRRLWPISARSRKSDLRGSEQKSLLGAFPTRGFLHLRRLLTQKETADCRRLLPVARRGMKFHDLKKLGQKSCLIRSWWRSCGRIQTRAVFWGRRWSQWPPRWATTSPRSCTGRCPGRSSRTTPTCCWCCAPFVEITSSRLTTPIGSVGQQIFLGPYARNWRLLTLIEKFKHVDYISWN